MGQFVYKSHFNRFQVHLYLWRIKPVLKKVNGQNMMTNIVPAGKAYDIKEDVFQMCSGKLF